MGPLAALDLNTYNLIFITVGMLLHWRPKRFLKPWPSPCRQRAAC